MIRTYIIILAVSAICAGPLFAGDEKNAPNVSYGIAGTGGIASIWQRKGNSEWGIGYCYGAGFVVEKMFTNLVGIHSGLWFIQSQISMQGSSPNGGSNFSADAEMRILSMPLYCILSGNKGIFSCNFLVGIDVSLIIDTNITNQSNKTVAVLRYITPYQFGVAMGLNFKFRVSKFVDIYFGILSDFYVTSMDKQSEHSNYYSHMYDARATIGTLFRTNIFPMPKK